MTLAFLSEYLYTYILLPAPARGWGTYMQRTEHTSVCSGLGVQARRVCARVRIRVLLWLVGRDRRLTPTPRALFSCTVPGAPRVHRAWSMCLGFGLFGQTLGSVVLLGRCAWDSDSLVELLGVRYSWARHNHRHRHCHCHCHWSAVRCGTVQRNVAGWSAIGARLSPQPSARTTFLQVAGERRRVRSRPPTRLRGR